MSNCEGVFTILHFGKSDTTEACIESLLRLSRIKECMILVLDNNSNNGSFEVLSHRFKDIRNVAVRRATGNGGFSKGNNELYQWAREYTPRFIAVLNNDILIEQTDFIQSVLALIDKHEYYVIGPDVYKPTTYDHQAPLYLELPSLDELDNNFISYYRDILSGKIETEGNKWEKLRQIMLPHIPRGLIHRYRVLRYKEGYTDRYGINHRNPVLQGSCVIFTEKYITCEEVAFEPDTHFYFEELLLALKCKTKGYDTLYTPELKVIHNHAVASKSDTSNYAEYMHKQAARMVAAFDIYKSCVQTNPWE